MGRKRKQPAGSGMPALVFIPTGEKVVIEGKTYILKRMFYDLKGEYAPLVKTRP